MKRHRLLALLGAFALTFGMASVALASPGSKVTICHATDSSSHPYTNPTVNISSSGHLQGGHDTEHLGPLWTPTSKADGIVWGDIIPPYTFQPDEGPLFVYDGHNWTADGQAIYNNGCKVPGEVEHDPNIHVEKTASTATLPAGGGSVTYTYVVTNTGNVPLTDVAVSDNKCSPVTYSSGDTNDDDILDQDESWTFNCTTTITETTTNTGVATGHDGETKVTDDDDATVTVEQPVLAAAIHIEKTVLPLTLPAGGGDVTYTYVVSNTGDLPLTNVAVTDDNGTPGTTSDDFGVDCPKTTLAVDESMTCTAAVTGTDTTTTNIATASGTAGETTVSDTDDATVTVAAPGGGVEAETDVPTAPQTDALSSTGDAGNALPLLLIVLGIVGLAAVMLTPARARRR
jgi:uncharacterized repeat protein (TIGR01451 family)